MHPSFQDVIFGFALLGRISDILTTWLVTPRLKLEANPIVRKLRWPFAVVTVLISFVAYSWPEVGVIIATTSFLVAASNASKIASARALGEDKLFEMAVTQAGRCGYWAGWFQRMASLPFYLFLAALIFFFYPSAQQWGHYIGLGVVIYVLAALLHWTLAYNRFRKLAKAASTAC